MNPLTLLHAVRRRLRRAVMALAVAFVLAQPALLAHAIDHALDGAGPVCEICAVAHHAADIPAVPVLPGVSRSPESSPFLPPAPPAAPVRPAAARDPPHRSLS
ncbi:MAG TPA: hypothetical protein VKA55_03010 [Gammaproteobacteria bacterium]|nr:hypothetical protein [Gammaproteobacteria bacterium]